MTSFVLVHGAWNGSWCWKRVRRLLQAQGHDVFTPTLTGVGERSHLLSRDVNLETHILDVVNLIRWEELSDIVLCGHSYGGCVISGVADRVPDRIRSLVYLDAFVLQDGENLLQHVPEPQRNQLLEGAAGQPEGWKVPPIPAEVFKVNSNDYEWVNRQCTPQPIETFRQRIQFRGSAKITTLRSSSQQDFAKVHLSLRSTKRPKLKAGRPSQLNVDTTSCWTGPKNLQGSFSSRPLLPNLRRPVARSSG